MSFSFDDVQYARMDGDEDGRNESAMLVFPDQSLLCLSDNDGDGVADYAAVDINLTKIVDFAAFRRDDMVGVKRFDADGLSDYEEFRAGDFGESFPGWAELLDVRFPDGVPDDSAFHRIMTVVSDVLYPDWTRPTMPWREGGLYLIPNEDGSYGIVKVLALDDVGVHIRRYGNTFAHPPDRVDESVLTLGAFDADAGSFAVGHLPVSARSFRAWGATLVQRSTVQPDELDGYQTWREAEGGYF